jgi:hypothetical protein
LSSPVITSPHRSAAGQHPTNATMTQPTHLWSLGVCSVGFVLAAIRLDGQAAPPGAPVAGEVATARSVYKWVEAAISARELHRRDTVITCAAGELTDSVTTYRDRAGVVRGLIWSGGTDDQAEQLRYYYDVAGRLRFALATRGAINGTQQAERVYFAESGVVLRRSVRTTHGPGYPFGEVPALQRPADVVNAFCR